MKRLIPSLLLLFGCLTLSAAPVSMEEARSLAGSFVQSTFESSRQGNELALVYAQPSFYVFNVEDKGFVIMSADDSYRPIIGYSDEGNFIVEDMAPALQEYLEGVNTYRMSRNAVADPEAAREWTSLRENGRPVSYYGGRARTYLVQTKWNQNYPYNYCCPEAPDGPGGHVYAGCVATAGAQLMKYWNHPTIGTGSHTYYPEDHPEYGPLTANFAEAPYDWDNMPNTISTASPIEQIEAIGRLIFHVGVSVDMNYRPSSSGAVTGKLCEVMPQYFYYTNRMENIYRESHTHDSFMALIVDAIDMSWPMVHRGGGHAYVLDGYDDNGLVHFNWGWSGNNDGWFDVDDHNYTDGESVIYNYVPAEIYSSTPGEATNLNATPSPNDELSATVTWNNPSVTLTNQPLTAIDQIVVMRGNEIIYTEDNVAPGAAMSIVDNVPMYSTYEYKVYAVYNGQRGKTVKLGGIHVGPTCQWKFVITSENMMGWRGARIAVCDAADAEATSVTVNNPNPVSMEVNVPLGRVKMVWVPTDNVPNDFNISFNIKDANNNSVYQYSGSILGMEAGLFYEDNNSCGNTAPSPIPGELYAETENGNVILTWPASSKQVVGYHVYRDGMLYQMVETNEFIDDMAPLGGHCYEVCVFDEGGESEHSNTACATVGEGCDPGTNLWLEIQSNGKPIIQWERPETEGLTGFQVYRKMNDDGEYEIIKTLGPNKVQYKETSSLQDGNWYYYQVYATYDAIECISAPFKAKYGNEYFVKVYYSVTGVEESGDVQVKIYPNPVKDQLTVEAENLSTVEVFDVLGQKMAGVSRLNGESHVNIDMSAMSPGVYTVRVYGSNGVSTHSFVKQ